MKTLPKKTARYPTRVQPFAPKQSAIRTFVDMFCGIGAFHHAAEMLGLTCVFASDVDEHARHAYEHNYGIRPVGDMRLIEASQVPDHDLFCAGFPCQPFSIIGNRQGFDDVRGTLFFEIVRIIKVKRPRAILLDNVKQLTSIDKGRTIARIVVEELLGVENRGDWALADATTETGDLSTQRCLLK